VLRVEELGQRAKHAVQFIAGAEHRRRDGAEASGVAFERLLRREPDRDPIRAVLRLDQRLACARLLEPRRLQPLGARAPLGLQRLPRCGQLLRPLREQVALLFQAGQLGADVFLLRPQPLQPGIRLGRARLRRCRRRLQLCQTAAQLLVFRARALLRPPALRQRVAELAQALLQLLESAAQAAQFFGRAGTLGFQRGALRFQGGTALLQLLALRRDLLQTPLGVRTPLLGDRHFPLTLGDPPGRLLEARRRRRAGAPRIRRLEPQAFEVRLRRGERCARGGLFLAQLLEAARRRLEHRADLCQLDAGDRDLERQAARPQLAVALRPPLLSRQATDLGLDFRDEVLEARQVCVGRLQPPLRDLPPVLVATDARGLLEHLPPLLRPVGQDPVHLPLLDHGV